MASLSLFEIILKDATREIFPWILFHRFESWNKGNLSFHQRSIVNSRTNRDKKEYKIFTYVSRIGFENGVNFAGMKIDSIIARISIYKWQSKREFISRARRSYRLNEFHRRETVPSYLIWTSPVPPRDSNSRFEFHGCQSKEREKERELVKTYVKRERGGKMNSRLREREVVQN